MNPIGEAVSHIMNENALSDQVAVQSDRRVLYRPDDRSVEGERGSDWAGVIAARPAGWNGCPEASVPNRLAGSRRWTEGWSP